MSQVITARLSRNDAQPWGFRLQGGKDFGTPLVIQKVSKTVSSQVIFAVQRSQIKTQFIDRWSRQNVVRTKQRARIESINATIYSRAITTHNKFPRLSSVASWAGKAF